MSEHNGGSMTVGFLMGAVVGAGLALLLAPASGSETRRHIGETAHRLKQGTQGRMDQAMNRIKEGAGAVGAAIDAGREEFNRTAERSANERSHV